MDKNSGSWFHHSSCDIGSANMEPAHWKLYSVEYPTLRNSPLFPFSEMQQPKGSQLNGSHVPNSFNLWHQLHPAYTPVLNSASREKFLSGTINSRQKGSPINCAAPPQKRFLVFDQSGGKTTLVYSSMMENPIHCGACLVPKPPPFTSNNPIEEEPMNNTWPLRPIMKDERIEDHSQDDMQHEIREDTEELNALLCSDSDSDYLKDDEEMSTGRSPSTMTENRIVEETGEESNCITRPAKRRKLSDGSCDLPSLRCSCSSLKTYAFTTFEDEAESTCRNNLSAEEFGSLSSNKRKERIQETLSMLQNKFPSIDSDNPISVIDKTIRYLRLLKVEAKTLGLDS